MKQLSILKNRHFLSLSGNGVMAVFGILTYSILYRFLSEEDMGNWVFFQFAFILLDTFRTGLLQTAVVKFYAGATEERKANVAGSAWYIGLLVTGILVLLNVPAYFTIPFTNDIGVLLLLKWYGISLIVTLPFNVGIWILQAEQRFDNILYIRLINQGSFIVLVFILYYINQVNLETIIYSFLASSFLASLITLVTGWARLMNLKSRSKACVLELFHFGKYSFGTFIGSNLFKSSDTFIIKFMLGPAALAVYNLPQRLMEIIEIPLRSFVSTAMPDMSSAVNRDKPEEVNHIMQKNVGLLTLCFIPLIIGVLLFADLMVMFIGGGKYVGTESANIFRILMVLSLIAPAERFLGITLDIIHKPHLNLIKVILSLGVNALTDVIAIKYLGSIYGAALASIFTLCAGLAYGYWALNKFLPISFRNTIPLGISEIKNLVVVLLRKKALSNPEVNNTHKQVY